MVSMIRRPAARRARPVSVISTTASAISGILASVAPWERRTSASTPWAARKRRVRPGYSVDTRTPAGRSPTDRAGESSAHGQDHPDGAGAGLAVAQLPSDATFDCRLLDPVPPGDPEVEQTLGHVFGDLLGTQDPHLGDPRVVDGGPVVHVRAALHRQVGGLEEIEGGPLERAFGQHQAQHGPKPYRHGLTGENRIPRQGRGRDLRPAPVTPTEPGRGPNGGSRAGLSGPDHPDRPIGTGPPGPTYRDRPIEVGPPQPTPSNYFGSWPSRLAISMAAAAASKPLLPALVPARSTACSMVSVVSTPKTIGTPVSSWARWTPAAHWPATSVVVAGGAPDDGAQGDHGVVAPAGGQTGRDQGQLEGARGPGHVDGLGVDAVAAQAVDGPVDQSGHDGLVEAAGGDGHPQSVASQLAFVDRHDTPPSSSRWPSRSRLVRR